jgi:hypothetical protein
MPAVADLLRIGSAEGFYGDDVTRALPMIEGGHVDVVCFGALTQAVRT